MSEPQALYAEALAVGEQMLALLQQPAPGARLEELEHLLNRRAELAAQTSQLAESGADLSAHRQALEALVAQQRQLETALRAAMAGLRQQRGDQMVQQQTLQATSRLLNTGPRSSLLNQRT